MEKHTQHEHVQHEHVQHEQTRDFTRRFDNTRNRCCTNGCCTNKPCPNFSGMGFTGTNYQALTIGYYSVVSRMGNQDGGSDYPRPILMSGLTKRKCNSGCLIGRLVHSDLRRQAISQHRYAAIACWQMVRCHHIGGVLADWAIGARSTKGTSSGVVHRCVRSDSPPRHVRNRGGAGPGSSRPP